MTLCERTSALEPHSCGFTFNSVGIYAHALGRPSAFCDIVVDNDCG